MNSVLPLPPRSFTRPGVYWQCRHLGCRREFLAVNLTPRAPRWAEDATGWVAPCGHEQVGRGIPHPQAYPLLATCDCCRRPAPLAKMLRDNADMLLCPACVVRPVLAALLAEEGPESEVAR